MSGRRAAGPDVQLADPRSLPGPARPGHAVPAPGPHGGRRRTDLPGRLPAGAASDLPGQPPAGGQHRGPADGRGGAGRLRSGHPHQLLPAAQLPDRRQAADHHHVCR